MSILRTDSGNLFYEDSATTYESHLEKPAIVFINGWALSSRYWFPVSQCLADRYRIIMFDQSGTGRSTFGNQRPSFTIESFTDEASYLISSLGLAQVHLVGHSMGSMITSELSHRHRSQVVSTTIVACGIFDFSAVQMEILTVFIRSTMNLKFLFHLEFFKQAFVRKATSLPIPKEYEKILVDDFLMTDAEAAEKVGTFSLNQGILNRYREQVVSIPSPLLLLVGQADKTIPPEGMATLYQSRLKEQPNLETKFASWNSVGHLPMLEKTSEFAATLAAHIENASKVYSQNMLSLSL